MSVQQNLIEYYRLFDGLSGVLFIEDDIVGIASPGQLVGSVVLSTHVAESEFESRVDRLFEVFEGTTHAIDWWVFPDCTPTPLGKRIVAYADARGAEADWQLVGDPGGPGGTWMLADLTTMNFDRGPPTDFRVARVKNSTDLGIWERLSAEGFETREAHVLSNAFARVGFSPDSNVRNYVGFIHDTPVCSATLFLSGGMVGVYNVSTPAAHRRRGFGSAVTLGALRDVAPTGYREAFLLSSRMGVSVYRDVGFDICDFGIEEYQWENHRASR